MYLRIMTQGLKVSHALHHIFNGIFVYNAAPAKPDIYPKTLCNQAFQNLHLDLAHDLGVNLFLFFLPDNMKLRLFFL